MDTFTSNKQTRVEANSADFLVKEGDGIKRATKATYQWRHLNQFRTDLVEASLCNCQGFADAFLPVNEQNANCLLSGVIVCVCVREWMQFSNCVYECCAQVGSYEGH